ncbi:MAG: hypothetical protein AAF703_02940 [Cyanobacteria bacterium P01_D01_bin.105]
MNKKILAAAGTVVGGAIALFVGAEFFASKVAAKEVDKAIDSVSEFADIDYQKVDASLLGGGVKVKGITIAPTGSGEQYRVDEVVVYDYDATEEDVPAALNMAINGVALNLADMGEQGTALKEFGYSDELSVNFATKYAYKEDEQEVRLEKFEVGADDVGDLDVSLHLSNVSMDPAAMANMPFALLGMTFHEAEITYDDDSLVTRMFETAAAAEGVSVEELKKEAIAGLEADLASGDDDLSKELVEEMKAFINNPDGFSIKFSPDEPVTFSQFMETGGDPTALVNLLNVRFES